MILGMSFDSVPSAPGAPSGKRMMGVSWAWVRAGIAMIRNVNIVRVVERSMSLSFLSYRLIKNRPAKARITMKPANMTGPVMG